MTVELDVQSMTCDGCEEIVRDALAGVSGVESVTTDRDGDTATVEGDVDAASLVRAVERAGYEATEA